MSQDSSVIPIQPSSSLRERVEIPLASALITELRSQTRLPGLVGLLATSANEHLELLALLQAGEGDAAERLMHRHIAHVIGWWAGRPEEE